MKTKEKQVQNIVRFHIYAPYKVIATKNFHYPSVTIQSYCDINSPYVVLYNPMTIYIVPPNPLSLFVHTPTAQPSGNYQFFSIYGSVCSVFSF